MKTLEIQAKVRKDREIRMKLPHGVSSNTVQVIVRYDQLKPHAMIPTKREFGHYRSRIELNENFDYTLPETFWSGNALLGGRK
ncbi:MAG: hypothetical protein D3917_14155 [Candidatus Electrothrix sp. AX5]|nr:hypothetical protein [Candidatus Electrothrix sp. AX5]